MKKNKKKIDDNRWHINNQTGNVWLYKKKEKEKRLRFFLSPIHNGRFDLQITKELMNEIIK